MADEQTVCRAFFAGPKIIHYFVYFFLLPIKRKVPDGKLLLIYVLFKELKTVHHIHSHPIWGKTEMSLPSCKQLLCIDLQLIPVHNQNRFSCT
jgi:hypothetical protein